MLDKNAFSPEHNSRIVVSPDDLSFEEDLIIHRPMMDFSGEYSDEEEEEEKEGEEIEEEDDPKINIVGK